MAKDAAGALRAGACSARFGSNRSRASNAEMHESAGQGTRAKNDLERDAITAARRTPAVPGCATQPFTEDECGNSNAKEQRCFCKAVTAKNAFQARNLTPELSRAA